MANNTVTPNLRWYQNNGGFSFTAGSSGVPSPPSPVLVGDLNCDGKPDLLTAGVSQVVALMNALR